MTRISTLFASLLLASSAVAISAQNATTFSLTYGYPLLAFEKVAIPLASAVGPNAFDHGRKLQTAEDKEVVRPNVDTLYSTAVFDLSRHDLVLTTPAIPASQYVLFSFYDLYGNNFANFGTNGTLKSGNHSLKLGGAARANCVATEVNDCDSEQSIDIATPGTFGVVLVRWLVKQDNFDSIHTWQNGTHLQPIARENSIMYRPAFQDVKWSSPNDTSAAEQVLETLAQVYQSNPPIETWDRENIEVNLNAAGIVNGTYTLQPDVNIIAALTIALLRAVAAFKFSLDQQNDGWFTVDNQLAGNFSANYPLRAAVAASSYLMLAVSEAIYPDWRGDSNDLSSSTASLSISADESYLYTFSAKPPISDNGFWSLTAYGDDNYLIANELEVYALGDRSNLTYPSGTQVYGKTQQDEAMFQILVQVADVKPPSNWTDNWLPGPAGGGAMTVLLRWYGGDKELIDGSYRYPTVTKIESLR